MKSIFCFLSEIKNIEANQVLVWQGTINSNVRLVLSGLLRSYVITSEGDERTILISKEKLLAPLIFCFIYIQSFAQVKKPNMIIVK